MKMFLVALALVVVAGGQPSRDACIGTWTGTSLCVGPRGACKDEVVVYRFVLIDNEPAKLRLYADKIIEGKRVPMGALDFEYDAKTGGVRCDFHRGTTHGIWSYAAKGDSLEGNLVTLPDNTRRRDVKAHRVKDETDVPPAPALKEYEE